MKVSAPATLALLCAATCGTPPRPATTPTAPTPAHFRGTRAMDRMRALMAMPRGLGDPARDASITALADMLAQLHTPPERHDFEVHDTDGTPYALTNLVVDLRPEATRRFVLATHFDTRPWADEEDDPVARDMPVPGANDGTSGVAVLLELAPLLLHALPPDIGFSIVLFDGEELGHGSDMQAYCAGSRRLAEDIDAPAFDRLREADFGIVLDMVGDRDLRIRPEPSSLEAHPALVDHIWATAADHGFAAFDPAVREHPVLDDQKFLTAAGIPSILLIDREYAPWHTRYDTLDKVDANSLEAVGETLRLALLSWSWERDG